MGLLNLVSLAGPSQKFSSILQGTVELSTTSKTASFGENIELHRMQGNPGSARVKPSDIHVVGFGSPPTLQAPFLPTFEIAWNTARHRPSAPSSLYSVEKRTFVFGRSCTQYPKGQR